MPRRCAAARRTLHPPLRFFSARSRSLPVRSRPGVSSYAFSRRRVHQAPRRALPRRPRAPRGPGRPRLRRCDEFRCRRGLPVLRGGYLPRCGVRHPPGHPHWAEHVHGAAVRHRGEGPAVYAVPRGAGVAAAGRERHARGAGGGPFERRVVQVRRSSAVTCVQAHTRARMHPRSDAPAASAAPARSSRARWPATGPEAGGWTPPAALPSALSSFFAGLASSASRSRRSQV
jgi:hypothetical protein